MGKRVCIICGNAREGLEVREDFVLSAMRWFKRNITRNEKGYRLVVCKECFLKYRKQRSSFERRRMLYVGLGLVFTITILAVSGGRFLGALAYGAGLTLFLYALALAGYIPALRMPRKDRS